MHNRRSRFVHSRSTPCAVIALVSLLIAACEDDPTPPPGDTTPPADITDLRAGEPTFDGATLWWTAPGDDGTSGRAARYEVRQLNGAITNDNWASATIVQGVVEAPRVAGEAETLLVGGLLQGQSYYFAVRAVDETSNWSGVSNSPTLSTLDGTAPSVVTNLVASHPTASTVTLSWTAPGDDGNVGRAAIYSIRWSIQPITNTNWNSAVPIPGVPAPQSAGFPEEFVVSGLGPETLYYFALRTADEASNISDLSNLVSVTTLPVAANQAELVQFLERSYQERNWDQFSSLLPAENQPDFLFLLEDGSNWGLTEELRVHRRMFEPESTPPGEPPVPPELWLESVTINLTPAREFQERTDLYLPSGTLNPADWKATDAEYHAELFFGTQGDTDYSVNGRANFVVIEDLHKSLGEPGKFLIYRWEDLGDWSIVSSTAGVEPQSWGRMKGLYR